MNGIIGAYCPSDAQIKWIQDYCNDAQNIIYQGENWIVKCFYPQDNDGKCRIVQNIQPNKDMIVFGDIFPNGQVGTPDQWADNSILHTFDGEFIRIVIDSANKDAEVIIDQNYCTPLFYAQSTGGGVFSSYLYAVHSLIGSPRQMSEKAVYDVLAYGYTVGEDTYFHNIKKLRSGHGVRFKQGQAHCFQYKKRNDSIDSIKADEDDVMNAMISATKLRLKGKNIAVALTGGMDSRFMLGLMTKYFPEYDLRAYTWSQPDSEELFVAQSACNTAGVELQPILLKPSDFIEEFYKCCKIHGGNDYIFQSYSLQVGEELAKWARTCVSGFFINLTFGASYIVPELTENKIIQPESFLNSLSGLKSKVFSQAELEKNIKINAKDYHLRLYGEYLRFTHECPFLQILYFVLESRTANHISYRHFLPSQYVEFTYLDTIYSVLQVLDRVPFEEKSNYGFYRKMFVNQFEELSKVTYFNTGLPIMADYAFWQRGLEHETQREKLFSEAFYGSKQSFPYRRYYSDFNHWISTDPAWRKMMEDTISDDSPLCNLVMDKNYLQKMLDEHISGKANHRQKLLAAATLDRVMRFYKITEVR